MAEVAPSPLVIMLSGPCPELVDKLRHLSEKSGMELTLIVLDEQGGHERIELPPMGFIRRLAQIGPELSFDYYRQLMLGVERPINRRRDLIDPGVCVGIHELLARDVQRMKLDQVRAFKEFSIKLTNEDTVGSRRSGFRRKGKNCQQRKKCIDMARNRIICKPAYTQPRKGR